MIRVNILTVKTTLNTHALHMPLMINKKLLKEMGIKVKFFYDLQEEIYDSDVLVLNSKFFIFPQWKKRNLNQEEFLKEAKNKVDRLIWFDNTDSTGACQFEVLPYVAGYYKGQILRNKEDYLRKFYGERVYTDFYHKKYAIEDKGVDFESVLPDSKYLDKIKVYWNSSLGDYCRYSPPLYHLRKLSPLFYFRQAKFITPLKKRSRDIGCRVGTEYTLATVRFHRKRIVEILKKRFELHEKKVSLGKYFNELSNLKIGVSPFGAGEIAYRDFEIILNGAMLMKPDMSHLETWPDLYKKFQTYIPFKWDCNDLLDKINQYLSRKKYVEIAVNGQNLYRKYLYDKSAQEEFCLRFRNIIIDTQ